MSYYCSRALVNTEKLDFRGVLDPGDQNVSGSRIFQIPRFMLKVSHKKSCLKCVEITNLQILRNLYFDFFFNVQN